ncbi:unnamed protein product [Arabidopsis thaliana]|uniref:(thale cress) hypothetical protein n=1 Tax=Arabidopsis thaliana TaxID=3702 RepID=A0A7G2FDD3_ARATH|nr:unnamed protein product [Arabidopsis thaliana]
MSLSFTSFRRLQSRRDSSLSCFFRQNPSPDTSQRLNQSSNSLIPSPDTDGSKPNRIRSSNGSLAVLSNEDLCSCMLDNANVLSLTWMHWVMNYTRTLIMKILRDNLTFWTSDMTDEAGDEIKEAEPKVLCKCHSCFTVLSEPKHS